MAPERNATNDEQALSSGVGESPEPSSFLVFEANGQDYSIEVETTEGVVDCPRFCPLPGAPEGIVGVASIRGRMTIVMDLGEGADHSAGKRRLVLLKGDARLGLLADRVYGVVAPPPGSMSQPKPSCEIGWPVKAILRHDNRSVPVLDVERLMEACVGPA